MVAMASAHHPTAGGGGGHKGYSLGIRDSIMIAHSFEGAEFGPAQQVTYQKQQYRVVVLLLSRLMGGGTTPAFIVHHC